MAFVCCIYDCFVATLRGVVALEGWSLSVEDGQLRQDLAGHGYILDAVS